MVSPAQKSHVRVTYNPAPPPVPLHKPVIEAAVKAFKALTAAQITAKRGTRVMGAYSAIPLPGVKVRGKGPVSLILRGADDVSKQSNPNTFADKFFVNAGGKIYGGFPFENPEYVPPTAPGT